MFVSTEWQLKIYNLDETIAPLQRDIRTRHGVVRLARQLRNLKRTMDFYAARKFRLAFATNFKLQTAAGPRWFYCPPCNASFLLLETIFPSFYQLRQCFLVKRLRVTMDSLKASLMFPYFLKKKKKILVRTFSKWLRTSCTTVHAIKVDWSTIRPDAFPDRL